MIELTPKCLKYMHDLVQKDLETFVEEHRPPRRPKKGSGIVASTTEKRIVCRWGREVKRTQKQLSFKYNSPEEKCAAVARAQALMSIADQTE